MLLLVALWAMKGKIPADRNFTVTDNANNLTTNESTVNVQTLEKFLRDRIDEQMDRVLDIVEDRTQDAILTAIDNIIKPRIEIAIRWWNASSGRNVASLTAISERGNYVGINASFENLSDWNNIFFEVNLND